MRRKTLLFILLTIIIAFAPVTNWHVDANYTRGVVWRLTMMATFAVGYWWNYIPCRKRKVNKNLTYTIE
jgi:hypothetical protein